MFFEMRFDLGTLDSGERSLPFGLLVSVVFDPILLILAGNEDMHKISDEFEFLPDRTLRSKKFPIDL